MYKILTTQKNKWLNTLFLLLLITISSFVVSCDMGDSDCNDFEVAIIGTDYAKVEIRNYPDSTFVTSETYDSEYVKTLHFTDISRGKYFVTAYCPYSNLQSNLISKVVDYSGGCESCDLYFDRE